MSKSRLCIVIEMNLVLFASFFLVGCATTTPLSPSSFGANHKIKGKAVIYWQSVSAKSRDSGTPSNYRKWIREILDQSFLQITEVSKLEDVAQSGADVVVIINFTQSFCLLTLLTVMIYNVLNIVNSFY